LNNHDPEVRAIVFTVFDTTSASWRYRAGAQGYLLKGAPREDVFTRSVLFIVEARSATRCRLEVIGASSTCVGLDSQPDAPTSRERDVLNLLARGLTTNRSQPNS
jgi:DNA-binding NarL/FixJ family response regulator